MRTEQVRIGTAAGCPAVDDTMKATIPSAGTSLSFITWARIVHKQLREHVSDLHVNGSPTGAEWSKGALRVQIDGRSSTWVVRFDRQGVFVMPPLTIDRHDDFSASNVAKTLMGFFDARLST